MIDVVFKEDPQIGSQIFTLKATTLVVVGGVSLSNEQVINLSDISPDYERIERRFHRLYVVPVFLSVLMGVGTWWISTSDISILVGVSAIMALGILLFMRFAPIEGARFLDRRGAIMFELFRPFKAAYAYDEFITALVFRINRAKDIISKEQTNRIP